MENPPLRRVHSAKNFAQRVDSRIARGRALQCGAWLPADGDSCLVEAPEARRDVSPARPGFPARVGFA